MRSALASYAPRSRFGSRLAVFLLQWDALGWAIEQIGNTVYVGGRFLDVTNGGETWPGWTTRVYGGNSAVQDLHLGDDGWLYVVGNFTTVSRGGNPEAASGAARIDPITGLIDSGWKPAISSSGSVWGVTTSEVNDLVYLSGSFLSVNGLAGTGGFVGGVEHALYVLDEQNGYSLVKQHYSACNPALNAVCLPQNWYGGEFQELEESGNRVYAVCHCWYDFYSDTSLIRHTQPHGEHSTVSSIAAIDSTTGDRIQGFRPPLTGDAGGWALHVNDARFVHRHPRRRNGHHHLAWPGPLDAVVERQVNGAAWNWRGRVSTASFSETVTANALTGYRAKYRYVAGQISEPTTCSPPIDLRVTLGAPPSCSAGLAGNTVILGWQPGVCAASHVAYRSSNGGLDSWRGRIDLPTTAFNDSVATGPVYQNLVRSRSSSGTLSAATPCSPAIQVIPVAIQPVASCTATLTGTSAMIVWPASANAASYLVYRSADGGAPSWRGKVEAPGLSFTDPLRAGPLFTYSVVARPADATVATATVCSPSVRL